MPTRHRALLSTTGVAHLQAGEISHAESGQPCSQRISLLNLAGGDGGNTLADLPLHERHDGSAARRNEAHSTTQCTRFMACIPVVNAGASSISLQAMVVAS